MPGVYDLRLMVAIDEVGEVARFSTGARDIDIHIDGDAKATYVLKVADNIDASALTATIARFQNAKRHTESGIEIPGRTVVMEITSTSASAGDTADILLTSSRR